MDVPILAHHVHFAVAQCGADEGLVCDGVRGKAEQTGLLRSGRHPGLESHVFALAGPVAPTRGRALDHIGMEIKNLEQFCKDLEAKGIKLDRGYSKAPGSAFGSAIVTDPWGTRIELTEGYESLF